MPRTRIKICGITRVPDALAAAEHGADAIGLVFYPQSSRHISRDRAQEILRNLPTFITPVALFVDADAAAIRSTCTPLGIRHVQLHGDESPALISQLSEFTLIKALRVAPATPGMLPRTDRFQLTLEVLRQTPLNVHAFLLDTASDLPGGSGHANNWTSIQSARDKGLFAGLPPIIAAGGLRPETVGQVVRFLRPYAVDVSTGVEEKPGEKSPSKIHTFIQAVREADASPSAS